MTRLPDERDMDQVVRSWLRDDDEHPADRNRQVGRIMGRVDETHQRRGAWRLLPFWRGARRIDSEDEDLFVQRGTAVGVRRGASSAVALAAVAVLIVIGVTFVALLPGPVAAPGAPASPTPSPAPTVHPDDLALRDTFDGTWSGARTSLSDVLAVYAEDAVHTAHWLDTVERFVGPHEILERIRQASTVNSAEWIPLPDAGSGEHRYLGVADDLGGTVCVIWVEDALITRHDCILPMNSTGAGVATMVRPADDTLEVWEAMQADLVAGWGGADRELIERTVSPDVVHSVAYDNHEVTLEGIDEYMRIMGMSQIRELAPPVPLPAPLGEHRWTDFSSVAGGSLCTFWERSGLIVRHDCIAPMFTYVMPTEPGSPPDEAGA